MTFNKIDYLKVGLCLIALISTITTEMYAQELPIEHYTALDDIDPLPESPVLTTYQDSVGYLWIANYGFGLLRYDGQSFEKYPGLNEALGMNIFALEQGPHGRLWALSNDKGLSISEQPLSAYQAGDSVQFSDSLGSVPLYKGRVDLFGDPLTKDMRGTLWLGTIQEGIIRYKSNGPTSIVADTLSTVLRSDSTYAPVRSMITRQDSSVWVSLINDSLLVFEDSEQDVGLKQAAPCIDILELFEDSNATLWAGCNQGEVWRLHDDSNTWENVKNVEGAGAYITGITEVATGLIWASTLGNGVWEFDITTGETVEYTRRNGLLDQNGWDVSTDREGNIWLSQNTGLSKLRMNQAAFRAYTSRSYTGERPALVGTEALASEPEIKWPLSNGDTLQVLATATSGGLSLIGSNNVVEHLTVENGLTSDLLLDVCEDALGRLWIMTRAGFDILTADHPAPDMPNFATEQQVTLFGDNATLTSYRIGMATECGALPKDWGQTESLDEAIVCFTKTQRPTVGCWAANRWLFFDEGSGLPTEAFRTLDWDADGHLYAGATYSGLYRSTVPLSYAIPDTLVGSSDSVVPFVRQPVFERVLGAEGEPLANTGITKVLRVGQSMWVQPSEATTLITEGDKAPRVTGEVDLSGLNEFPNTMVYSPFSNTVWISTDEGIIEIDTSGTRTGRRADQLDGLLYHTASGPPALRIGSSGMIYHSSTAGVTRYQPSRDRQNNTPPRLDFRSIKYSEDNAGSNELEITYAALSYTSERQVRYRTRLLGYDDNWSEPTSETRARYTNLSAFALPRTYTFEVQASNNDGVWTEIPLAHEVRVEPAWWMKWWALTLYSGFFLTLVLVTDRLQRKRLIEQEREKARERELEQARETERAYTQLAESHQELKRTQDQLIQQEKLASLGQLTAGIAHEIKNPLNFVNNFSEVSLEMVEEAREEVKRQKAEGKSKTEETSISRGESESRKPSGEARGVSDGTKDVYQTQNSDEDSSSANTPLNPLSRGEAGSSPQMDLILEILDDIEANLKTIHKHGSRADSIVKSMLQHSRGGDGKMEPTPLNPLIKEYVNLAFHGMRAGSDPINVDIDLQLDEEVCEVPLIAEDFSRVILNLVNNGFDAMREKTLQGFQTLGGLEDYQPKLTVRTKSNSNTITIEIEDNGPGIPEEIKDKILQPFFTTKKGTAGTGLGLSITNDIVKAHGGVISIDSENEAGSKLIIQLKKR
jgi:signal transduction histidine kinase/ligand-binding sensor domain-containing protein